MTTRRSISAVRLAIDRVALAFLFCAGAASLFAAGEKKGPELGSIVKDLYEAHQNGSPLFQQTKDQITANTSKGSIIPYEGFAIVDVTFTASGTPKYVSYQITTEGSDKGKISNIRYDDLPSLVGALNRDRPNLPGRR